MILPVSSSAFLLEYGLSAPLTYSPSRGNLGTNGSNTIVGKNQDDVLQGLKGHDVLMGMAGNDVLNGGRGNDTADYSFSDSYITEINGYRSVSTFKHRSTYIDLAKGFGRDQFGDKDHYISIENVEGGQQRDKIIGNAQDNVLAGWGGNDRLSGGRGDDILAGGAGRNVLTGGQGRDMFAFTYINRVEDKPDIITDFKAGQDQILIVGDSFYADLQFNFSSPFPALLPKDFFFLGSKSQKSSDIWGYNQSNGNVIFDPDGTGKASATVVVTLRNRPTDFSASDIFVV